MGPFRATIQYRRKTRLLVSGVAPFEELGPPWNDRFINLRELRVGHLDETTSVDLLCRPIPEFPPGAVSAEIRKMTYQRTGGQPYLLQLYGTLLINRLNVTNRSAAEPDDVRLIEEEALMQGRYYFENTYKDAPRTVQWPFEGSGCRFLSAALFRSRARALRSIAFFSLCAPSKSAFVSLSS